MFWLTRQNFNFSQMQSLERTFLYCALNKAGKRSKSCHVKLSQMYRKTLGNKWNVVFCVCNICGFPVKLNLKLTCSMILPDIMYRTFSYNYYLL